MNRARIFLAACGLAVAGVVAASLVNSSGGKAEVELSTRQHGSTPTTSELPDLFVPTNEPEPTTSTTTTVAPPTTLPHVVPTTMAPVSTTVTTAKPVPTTTMAPNTVVIESIVNHYVAALDYAIASDNSNYHGVIQPNQTVGPVTIVVGAHDSSGSHRIDDPTCGRGDQDSYFTVGHRYTIEVISFGAADGCGETHVQGYISVLRDLTAGTERQFG